MKRKCELDGAVDPGSGTHGTAPYLQIRHQPSGTCSQDAMACRQHAKCHRRARPTMPRSAPKLLTRCHGMPATYKMPPARPPRNAREYPTIALTPTRGLMPGVSHMPALHTARRPSDGWRRLVHPRSPPTSHAPDSPLGFNYERHLST